MAEQKPVLGVEISGWGAALPHRSVTNEQLIEEYGLDSSDEWIAERTGIQRRHIISEGEDLVSLSVEAVEGALLRGGIMPGQNIDKLFLGTTSSYREVPGSHPAIAHHITEYGYPVTSSKESNTACTGFVTSLLEAYRNFAVDGIDRAVVVGADTLSIMTDYNDRSTGILFADGAGAVAMQRTKRQEAGLLGWYEETDGSAEEILYCNRGENIMMNGREVYRKAIGVMAKAGEIAMEHAGVTIDDIALTVPHQANIRIIEAAAKKLKADMDKMVMTIHKHGNTSSASIPLALAEAADDGRIYRGEKLLLVGFGAGMTAAAAVIKW